MHEVSIPIQLISDDAKIPEYAHLDDAGLDLRSIEEVELRPLERKLIKTGVAIAIPRGYAGFVQPRSGLAIKYGLSLVNTPGLIDANYRGEIQIPAINFDPQETIHIMPGDRIAQLVILPVAHATLSIVSSLDDSPRGAEGFGSSGHK